ncbi:MAG: UDP-N-acetylmuramoyl-L-alanyl-D-glutamate--2,6-diaminopimelate ligase [Legionella sp.]|nr:UDP-N-acetylmuramoyl-L-alanyl-D-glutamate--2,6-diaminopimelate ligase [Legionella sp.]
MKLNELMHPWSDASFPAFEILGLDNDSRRIKPGFLFFAYPGHQTDGRLFITQALSAGASAIVYEPAQWPADVPKPPRSISFAVQRLAECLPAIASRFYLDPSQQLSVVGITGTNGKTSVAYQLTQAEQLLNGKAAYIGTIGQGILPKLSATANTTPDALCLQRWLAEYQTEGARHVFLEVSSHALCQGRVDGVAFTQAIFTNLSHEHLDYHQNMEAYAKAKSQLFTYTSLKSAILNQDDPYSQRMRKAVVAPQCQILTYGLDTSADVSASEVEVGMAGSQFQLSSPWGNALIRIRTVGLFNVYNALTVLASLLARGYSLTIVSAMMKQLTAPPGRMEVVSQEPCVIVDYAHTPDALEQALRSLNRVKKGRLLVVFGCGGNRDTEKRPQMGEIASRYADQIILTNDNPRRENPREILNAISKGIPSSFKCLDRIEDRKQAITQSISLMSKQDVLLIAGKGHEDYQEVGAERYAFSDQEVVRDILGKC